jgi:hypothetical protein
MLFHLPTTKKIQIDSRGITLIELILYTGLLLIVLTVFYELFSIAGYQKLVQVVEQELYSNGQHAMYDIQQEIEQASVITEPLSGGTSNILRLDGGAVEIAVVGNSIVKTKNSITAPLTDDYVIVDSLSFSQFGPSIESPTVTISFTLRSRNDIQGRIRTETFKSSVSLR